MNGAGIAVARIGEPGDVRCTVEGEELLLLPERAAYWARRSTLLIADPHFGKAATFRSAGVPVPAGTTGGTLARIDAALGRTGATRLVFLGDFLHAREGRAASTIAALGRWREDHERLDVVLVRGNHDRRAGDPPGELGVRCVNAPLLDAPFAFVHHPGEVTAAYAVAGHIHPAVTMVGPARQRERLACFWFGARCAVLPAFGEFTGFANVEPVAGDQVFVIAGNDVRAVATA